MSAHRLLWWLCAILVGGTIAAPGRTNLVTATSVSGQFVANSEVPVHPLTLCVFAERLKQAWLTRLGMSDNWRDPIVLSLRKPSRPGTPKSTLHSVYVGPVLKYEVVNEVVMPLDQKALAVPLVTILCMEMVNRERVANTPEALVESVPLWLAVGLAESILGKPEVLVRTARETAAIPVSVETVMKLPILPEGTAEYDTFRAHAWLLTEGLLRLPEGGLKLQRFLKNLSRFREPDKAFAEAFSADFPEPATCEKWWSQLRVRQTRVTIAQNLSMEETARRLQQLLVFEGGRHFDSLERYSEERWLKAALAERLPQIAVLLNWANPIYRDTIQSYLDAGRLLLGEKVSRYRRMVRRAAALRIQTERQARAIQEAIDLTEQALNAATNAVPASQPVSQSTAPPASQPRNPISEYLDKFDR